MRVVFSTRLFAYNAFGISVPLGNEGQLTYVGANSFMDALAQHRHICNLPGLSLQLGAWESEMIKGLDMIQGPIQSMSDKEGTMAVLKAMGESSGHQTDVIQVIAKLDLERLRETAAARDAIFENLFAMQAPRIASPSVRLAPGDAEKIFRVILAQFLDIPDTEIGKEILQIYSATTVPHQIVPRSV